MSEARVARPRQRNLESDRPQNAIGGDRDISIFWRLLLIVSYG